MKKKEINWELLPELISAGKSFVEIAKILGCDNSSVSRRAKKLGLDGNFKICKANDPDLIKQVGQLVDSGLTTKQIAEELKIAPKTVLRYTRLSGRDSNSIKSKSINNVQLSQEQLEVIYGSMLGDMSMSKTKKLARITINQGGGHEEYFDSICSLFPGLLGKVSKTPRFDNRTKKYYNKFYVRTLAHSCYLELFNFFYPNGVKTITKEWVEKLSPKSIAYWFMDDGSLNGEFATNCFSLNEVNLLREMFSAKYSINTRLYKVPNKEQYVLFICKESLKAFEDLIRPYILPCMQYKLKYKS